MNNQHTPGPWTVREAADYLSGPVSRVMHGSRIVAECYGPECERPRNAQLFAQAPAMLELLRKVWGIMLDERLTSYVVYDEIGELIKKVQS